MHIITILIIMNTKIEIIIFWIKNHSLSIAVDPTIALHQVLEWIIELLVTIVMVPEDQEYQQLRHKLQEKMVLL